jgi:hypothetical protein
MEEILAHQFIADVNRMHESLTLYEADQRLGHQPHHRLVQCATAGCSLLKNDVYVQALVDDARKLRKVAAHHHSHMEETMRVDHFESFLLAERRLLWDAGADSRLAEAIIERCRETREVARQGKYDANKFHDALETLRFQVCDELTELRKVTFAQQRRERSFRRLAAVLKGIHGCIIVGLDASPMAAAILTPAGQAVSIAVGSGIVSLAIDDLLATGRHRRTWLLRSFRPQ